MFSIESGASVDLGSRAGVYGGIFKVEDGGYASGTHLESEPSAGPAGLVDFDGDGLFDTGIFSAPFNLGESDGSVNPTLTVTQITFDDQTGYTYPNSLLYSDDIVIDHATVNVGGTISNSLTTTVDSGSLIVTGAIDAGTDLDLSGVGVGEEGLARAATGGTITSEEVIIGAYSSLNIQDEGLYATTNANDSVAARTSLDVQANGVLDVEAGGLVNCLLSGVDADGISSAGCNIGVAVGGTVTNAGEIRVHRELEVLGTVTNSGNLSVAASSVPRNELLIGCAPAGPSCTSPSTALLTNTGSLEVGTDLRVVSGLLDAAGGTVELGCTTFSDTCVPANTSDVEGVLIVSLDGQLDVDNGASIETSTGQASVFSCGADAAFVTDGAVNLIAGIITVNGNACISSAGDVDVMGASSSTYGTLLVAGESAGTADGHLEMLNGSHLSLNGSGLVRLNSLESGKNAVIDVESVGHTGSYDLDGDASPETVEFPLIVTDVVGTGTERNLEVGTLTTTAGTVYASNLVVVVNSGDFTSSTTYAGAIHVEDEAAIDTDTATFLVNESSTEVNTFWGEVRLGSATTFETDKSIVLVGQTGSNNLEMSSDAALDMTSASTYLQVGAQAEWIIDGTSTADLAGYLWVQADNSDPGEVYFQGDSVVDIGRSDDETYYVGGDVWLTDNASVTMPTIMIKAPATQPAHVRIED
ncbi:MAG: hypothetical protein KC561_13630, partial [Myxococcales bacterium]|nr:hypothetical protein [Myxococcales bacterium]